MAEFIALLQKEGYSFSEILLAISEYATREKNKILCEKPSWEVVSAILELSAYQTMLILKYPAVRHKYVFLEQTITKFLQNLREDEYQFTEVLHALSSYVREEGNKNPNVESAWREVSLLLQLGAQQAQVEGRELNGKRTDAHVAKRENLNQVERLEIERSQLVAQVESLEAENQALRQKLELEMPTLDKIPYLGVLTVRADFLRGFIRQFKRQFRILNPQRSGE